MESAVSIMDMLGEVRREQINDLDAELLLYGDLTTMILQAVGKCNATWQDGKRARYMQFAQALGDLARSAGAEKRGLRG